MAATDIFLSVDGDGDPGRRTLTTMVKSVKSTVAYNQFVLRIRSARAKELLHQRSTHSAHFKIEVQIYDFHRWRDRDARQARQVDMALNTFF
jgi:hypothetical protein